MICRYNDGGWWMSHLVYHLVQYHNNDGVYNNKTIFRKVKLFTKLQQL